MNHPLSILVVAERLQGQGLQEGLLLGEHRRHLPLGAAMDALIGPTFFPVIEISLSIFQALEAFSLECSLGMSDAGLDFAFAIGIFDSARQGDGAVVRQHIAIKRVQLCIEDVGSENTFTKIIENDDAWAAAQSAEGLLM